MGRAINFFKSSNPLAMAFMAIAVTTAVTAGYKGWYAPYARRQRLLKAEEWAEMIIKQEENSTPSTEQF